jgi:serine protease AprX
MNARQNLSLKRTLMWTVALMLAIATITASAGISSRASAAETQSYIVQSDSAEQAARLVEQYGGSVTSYLEIINGVGALLTSEVAQQLAELPGVRVTINARMKINSAPAGGKPNKANPETDYPDVVGADAVWAAGVTGKGVTVAVLDTGMAKTEGLIRATSGPGDRILAWQDFVERGGRGRMVDPNGHGTHVTGVIANSQKGADGEWNGVAPDVNLVIGRVADENGFATYERVIQGVDWVVTTKDRYNTRILNLSMSAPVRSGQPGADGCLSTWDRSGGRRSKRWYERSHHRRSGK